MVFLGCMYKGMGVFQCSARVLPVLAFCFPVGPHHSADVASKTPTEALPSKVWLFVLFVVFFLLFVLGSLLAMALGGTRYCPSHGGDNWRNTPT